jgi:hypothetical protein
MHHWIEPALMEALAELPDDLPNVGGVFLDDLPRLI